MGKWIGLAVVGLIGVILYASGWVTYCTYPVHMTGWVLPRSRFLWIALGVAGVWDAVLWRRWYASRVRRVRAARGRCLECGYDLIGNVSGRCPECGQVVPRRLCGEPVVPTGKVIGRDPAGGMTFDK